ncbi:MAG: FAD-binding protein [Paludibacteraceae bacterium]|nr:FAD-binding protein [Paludibacteraceae bacterium]
MKRVLLTLTPEQAADTAEITKAVAREVSLPSRSLGPWHIVKRSVDARQRQLKILLTVDVCTSPEEALLPPYEKPVYLDVSAPDTPEVNIIGMGPAGLFAALTLLEHGIRPVIFERGKDVSERKKDIALLNRNEGLNAESNYCFGEGGAGTFSDGKLFSRSSKRGNMQRVMELFHFFGADDSVLYEAHAHIGSDKLPSIIRRMRETILEHGGIIRFDTCVTTLDRSRPTILAIGHSAHDTYRMLMTQGIALEPKGFAMGVRVEHPQALIDRLMYHGSPLRAQGLLPAASYSLVTQVRNRYGQRGVYSFCMCPGGHIVPAATDPESIVVNGMSASHRNSPYANSGMVVELHPEDLSVIPSFRNSVPSALEWLAFQEHLEHLAWQHGAEAAGQPQSMIAPAQRLDDFVFGRDSKDLPGTSYLPGCRASRLDRWMPEIIALSLREGFRAFDRKYPGFLTREAVVVGVESRSSSPVRIPRDPLTMTHPDCPNLYPAGEGAGYAGGITSSALDGIRAAEAVCKRLNTIQS